LGKVRGKLSVENVVDMLENARWRIAYQGRYDDGVARLYRTIEMWHQWRLSKHSISTEKVDWRKMDEAAREQFLKEAGLNKLPEILGLHNARLVDCILSGAASEAEVKDNLVLRDLLQKRNRSILAHGLESIAREPALRFLEYVDTIVEAQEAQEARVGAEHARLRGL
jgi:hypothetical protein